MEKLLEMLKKIDRETAHKLVDNVYDMYEVANAAGLLDLLKEQTAK